MAAWFYRYGGWRTNRLMPPPTREQECVEEALGTSEPGGRLNPAA
jgi:hypothetical protein